MKLNDFENDPHHTNELPVNPEADAFASNSPDALPTCAPDALIAPARAELHAHWQRFIPSFAAVRTWHERFGDLSPRVAVPVLN